MGRLRNIGNRLRAGGATASPIAALFAAGEQGGWYDPSDLSTVFTDTAGTTPASVGQGIARINDKSGRGNNLIQATAGSRPILRLASGLYYLEFDGLDDALVSAATVNYTATDKVTICIGQRKEFDQSGSMLVEHTAGADSASSGGFGLDTNGYRANGAWLGGAVCGSASSPSSADSAAATMTSPVLAVVTMQGDNAGATIGTEIVFRKDGVALGYGSVSAASATGNFSTSTTYVGARGGTTLCFTGRMYVIVIRGAATSGATLSSMETAVGAKCGVTI